MRGRDDNRKFAYPSFTAQTVAALCAILALLGLAACGSSGPRQDADFADEEYSVRIVDAELEPVQSLGDATMMRLAVENTGDEAIPNLAVTVKLLGEEGEAARDAFAYRNPQRSLNRHDRPIWILDPGYPTLADDPVLGSAGTASARTFAFGELPAGETVEAVWKLTPVKAGNYRLRYEIAPDIFGSGQVEAEDGGAASGELVARVKKEPQQLRVDDRGRVVPAGNKGP